MLQEALDAMLLGRSALEGTCIPLVAPVLPMRPMSLETPNPEVPQLGFVQTVAWLYGYYFEAGRVTFNFLEAPTEHYLGTTVSAAQQQHRNDVRDLRTSLQHNLNLSIESDQQTDQRSERWFTARCGKRRPIPLDVEIQRNDFIQAPFFSEYVLASAFYLTDVRYRWERGRRDALKVRNP